MPFTAAHTYIAHIWQYLPPRGFKVFVRAVFHNFYTPVTRVVGKVDSTIRRISHYPADSVVCFVNTYPLDSDLSGG